MQLKENKEPRKFTVGEVEISDVGKIILEPDELVSFVTSSGKEYDFVAKEWGYYVTPSINARLKKEGFKTALMKNIFNKYFLMAVDIDKKDLFERYCSSESLELIEWLDEKD